MRKDAVLSECQQYRYSLSRIWDEKKPLVGLIGLNPSTADHLEDDNTILRCITFSKAWGFGGFYMMNLFAYRATKPSVMMESKLPIGSENDKYLLELKNKVQKVVVCWGNNGSHNNRSQEVLKLFHKEKLYCIEVNKSGEPAHPLYLKGCLDLKPYITLEE